EARAEYGGQQGDQQQWNDRRQAEQKGPAQQPADLSSEDQTESRPDGAPNQHVSAPGSPMPRLRSCPGAGRRSVAPASRAPQTFAGRNPRWRGSLATPRIVPARLSW